jgi:hypothetical protein
MVHQRRVDHAAVVTAESRTIFSEARALIESRLGFAREQFHELTMLQGKNQKLVETLARKATVERARLDKARTEMVGLRGVTNRHADDLAKLLNPNTAREAGMQARSAVLSTRFSGGIGQVLDTFFAKVRGDLERAIVVIGEVQAMMTEAKRKFATDYGMLVETGPEFATERFLVELDRLEEYAERDFKSATSLLTRGRSTLGSLFFDTVALKVIYVFEIADREVRAWMASFIRPLDAQLISFQEQTNARIEGMGRIQNAETDLVVRLGELQALHDGSREPARAVRCAPGEAARAIDRGSPLVRLGRFQCFVLREKHLARLDVIGIEGDAIDRADFLALGLVEVAHALGAARGIDHVELDAHGDRLVRALRLAHVAVDALVGDLEGHGPIGLRVPASDLLLHALRGDRVDEGGDVASQHGDLAHDRGGEEQILVRRREEQRFDAGREAPVHSGELEFVLEVRHRPEAPQDEPRFLLLHELREQSREASTRTFL